MAHARHGRLWPGGVFRPSRRRRAQRSCTGRVGADPRRRSERRLVCASEVQAALHAAPGRGPARAHAIWRSCSSGTVPAARPRLSTAWRRSSRHVKGDRGACRAHGREIPSTCSLTGRSSRRLSRSVRCGCAVARTRGAARDRRRRQAAAAAPAAGGNAVAARKAADRAGRGDRSRETQWGATPLGFADYGEPPGDDPSAGAALASVWHLVRLGEVERLRDVFGRSRSRARRQRERRRPC